MKASTLGITIGIFLVVLLGLGALGSLSLPGQNLSTTNSSTSKLTQSFNSSSSTTSANSTTSSVVTLQDIISGRFPTASDKQGTGGVTVTVHNLLVLYVRTESDGDWHLGVTDGQVSVFITEITPAYESSIGKPVVGSTIDETGIAYCDTNHQSENWHGNTCWEIHPITSWILSSGPTVTTIATTTQTAVGLNVSIAYASNPISRGSTQTITVWVG